MWFEEDGATSPTANVTINLLASKFGERVISGNGRLGRTIDCFLWGYVKSMPTSHRWLNFVRISNVKLLQYRPIYAWKSSKIGFSVWTSAIPSKLGSLAKLVISWKTAGRFRPYFASNTIHARRFNLISRITNDFYVFHNVAFFQNPSMVVLSCPSVSLKRSLNVRRR